MVLEMGNQDSGSESVYSRFESFGSSSFSDMSTLVGSELDSTEVESTDEEDDEFMAELTRQMADYMLQEDDDVYDTTTKDKEQAATDCDSENFKDSDGQGLGLGGINDSSVISSSLITDAKNTSFHSFTGDHMPRLQLYQLEEQPRVTNNVSMSLGIRRVGKKGESTQHDKMKQDYKQNNNLGLGRSVNAAAAAYPYVGGSGMRAVFLGGAGSRKASSGTGVFLPRPVTSNTPDQTRKKSGCSTVLIPTRVLQALEQHFSNIESSSPSSCSKGHPAAARNGNKDNTQEKRQPRAAAAAAAAVDLQVSQLPQEWTY